MRWTRRRISEVESVESLTGKAVAADEVLAAGERDRNLARQDTTGYRAVGPRFYVWDEDPRQVRQWAAELGRSDAT